MNLSHPYKSIQKGNNFYFTTNVGTDYKVSFDTAFQHQFEELKIQGVQILEFSFAPLDTRFLHQTLQAYDPRIKLTIMYLIKEFYNNNETAIIYNCLSIDNKQKARSRLFSK